MSDAYLPMLLANMQQEIANLRMRVEALEEMVEQDESEDEAGTYMDGTPVL